jgi:hypothetical protein
VTSKVCSLAIPGTEITSYPCVSSCVYVVCVVGWFAEKEKVYSRQYSAPILKRKSSRFGLGQFLGSIPPNNSMPGSV